jgi:hypothetical protein
MGELITSRAFFAGCLFVIVRRIFKKCSAELVGSKCCAFAARAVLQCRHGQQVSVASTLVLTCRHER